MKRRWAVVDWQGHPFTINSGFLRDSSELDVEDILWFESQFDAETIAYSLRKVVGVAEPVSLILKNFEEGTEEFKVTEVRETIGDRWVVVDNWGDTVRRDRFWGVPPDYQDALAFKDEKSAQIFLDFLLASGMVNLHIRKVC